MPRRQKSRAGNSSRAGIYNYVKNALESQPYMNRPEFGYIKDYVTDMQLMFSLDKQKYNKNEMMATLGFLTRKQWESWPVCCKTFDQKKKDAFVAKYHALHKKLHASLKKARDKYDQDDDFNKYVLSRAKRGSLFLSLTDQQDPWIMCQSSEGVTLTEKDLSSEKNALILNHFKDYPDLKKAEQLIFGSKFKGILDYNDTGPIPKQHWIALKANRYYTSSALRSKNPEALWVRRLGIKKILSKLDRKEAQESMESQRDKFINTMQSIGEGVLDGFLRTVAKSNGDKTDLNDYYLWAKTDQKLQNRFGNEFTLWAYCVYHKVSDVDTLRKRIFNIKTSLARLMDIYELFSKGSSTHGIPKSHIKVRGDCYVNIKGTVICTGIKKPKQKTIDRYFG